MVGAGGEAIDAERLAPVPPIDPEVAWALDRLRLTQPEAFESLTPDSIERFRRNYEDRAEQQFEATRTEFADDFLFQDRVVPGPRDNPDLAVLVATPVGGIEEAPAIYWIHGGGMVLGSHRGGLREALTWGLDLHGVVVSVDYRLAPEHPHPAPVEDCYAGLAWLSQKASSLGVDSRRILIAGASAGAGLAAAVALLARDRGGPDLLGQMLIGPMLDDRESTHSSTMLEGGGLWDRASNRTGWTALLGDAAGGVTVSAYAAPARASDLSGLPQAYLDAGTVETFRDDVVNYATLIWQAGGEAELHVWAGGCHGFPVFAPTAAVSIDAVSSRRQWVRRVLPW